MRFLVFVCALWSASAVATIKVDSDGTYKHGQYVSVSWDGIETKDRDGCWIGLFFFGANLTSTAKKPFPATPPFLESAPIKFVSCSGGDFQQTGSGTYSVRLLAYRQPLEVALFTNGYGSDSKPLLLARSGSPLIASDAAEPRFPRLARTRGGDSEMQLTWSSMEARSTYAYLSVKSGSPAASQRVWSSVQTYGASSLCNAPANSTGYTPPGFHHTVVFTGLSPGVYSYHVGVLAGEFQVRDSASVRIGVIADVGATEPDGMHYHWEEPNASTTYNGTWARNPDIVLHLGDLAYATGYEAKWDLFLDQMAPLSARVPYMTALGNHEQDWETGSGARPHALDGSDSGGECGLPTRTRFPMPAANQAAGWYQFAHGPVSYVILNSEWNVSAGSPQHAFMRSALAAVDRKVTPWVVVGSHRPIYTGNSTDGKGDAMLGANDVEDLLREFEVDFMLYGHVHNAQRTCPMYRAKCTNATVAGGFAGTVHAVIGNGGQSLIPFPKTRAPWSLFQLYAWGFNELEINRSTAVLRFFSDSGALLDETTYSATRYFASQSSFGLVV